MTDLTISKNSNACQKRYRSIGIVALMDVKVRRVNFTTKSRFQNIKLRSFNCIQINSQGSTVEKNSQAQIVQMRRICFQPRLGGLGGEICSSDVITHEGRKFWECIR